MNDLSNTLQPDLERIAILEQAFRDFRLYFEEENPRKKAALVFKHQFRPYYFMLPPAWRIALRLWNWKQRVRPDFISTGAVRSGTSALSSYIFQHPCVVLPLAKENMTWHRLNILMAQFPLQKEKEAIEAKFGIARVGTGTPVVPSLTWPYLAKALNPDLKIVVVLRNPVDRVVSQWQWDKMVGQSTFNDPLAKHLPDFDEHMQMELDHFHEGVGLRTLSGPVTHSYLANSIYLPFLKKCEAIFGKEHLKIISATDFFNDPLPIVKDTYEFLGLPTYEPVAIKETNPSFPIDVRVETREKLSAFFKPYNQTLYDYLGINLHWDAP